MCEHLGDRCIVGVQQHGDEGGFEILGQRQIQHPVERPTIVLGGELGDAASFAGSVLGTHDLEHAQLLPFTVEESYRCGFAEIAFDGVAEPAIRENAGYGVRRRRERRRPGGDTFERIGRTKSKFHGERAA